MAKIESIHFGKFQKETFSINGSITAVTDLSSGSHSGIEGSGIFSLGVDGITILAKCEISAMMVASDAAGPDFCRAVMLLNGATIAQNEGYRNASGGTTSSAGMELLKCEVNDKITFISNSNSGIASNSFLVHAKTIF